MYDVQKGSKYVQLCWKSDQANLFAKTSTAISLDALKTKEPNLLELMRL